MGWFGVINIVPVIFLSWVFQCCGPDIPIQESDRLSYLLDQYQDDARAAGMNMDLYGRVWKIEYGYMEDGYTTGTCHILGSRGVFMNRIVVRPGMSEPALRWTVYHELTHCVYLVGHIDNRPHLMNTYMLPDEVIETQWESLVDGLFDSVRNSEAPVGL